MRAPPWHKHTKHVKAKIVHAVAKIMHVAAVKSCICEGIFNGANTLYQKVLKMDKFKKKITLYFSTSSGGADTKVESSSLFLNFF